MGVMYISILGLQGAVPFGAIACPIVLPLISSLDHLKGKWKRQCAPPTLLYATKHGIFILKIISKYLPVG